LIDGKKMPQPGRGKNFATGGKPPIIQRLSDMASVEP
jgi:hypothetical protein